MEPGHYLRAVDQLRKACPLVEIRLRLNVIEGLREGETVLTVSHLSDRMRIEMFRRNYYKAVDAGVLRPAKAAAR